MLLPRQVGRENGGVAKGNYLASGLELLRETQQVAHRSEWVGGWIGLIVILGAAAIRITEVIVEVGDALVHARLGVRPLHYGVVTQIDRCGRIRNLRAREQ